jgi:uncharacterized protein YggE
MLANVRTRILSVLYLSSFLAMPLSSGFAQGPGPDASRGISAIGTAREPLAPTHLRLVMPIKAQAKDAKGAIAALAQYRAKVQQSLEEMKSDTKTIKFSETLLSESVAGMDGGPQQARQMQMQMMQMQSGRGGKASSVKMEDLPKSFVASCSVRVDWILTAKMESDAIAILKNRLESEIEKRELMKSGAGIILSDEEQEMIDVFESQGSSSYGYSSSDQKSGPRIMLVANVSPELQAKLLKQAIEKANSKAQSIAVASGVKLGPIKNVQQTADASEVVRMNPSYYYPSYQNNEIDTTLDEPNESEVVGTSLHALQARAAVSVTFDIL